MHPSPSFDRSQTPPFNLAYTNMQQQPQPQLHQSHSFNGMSAIGENEIPGDINLEWTSGGQQPFLHHQQQHQQQSQTGNHHHHHPQHQQQQQQQQSSHHHQSHSAHLSSLQQSHQPSSSPFFSSRELPPQLQRGSSFPSQSRSQHHHQQQQSNSQVAPPPKSSSPPSNFSTMSLGGRDVMLGGINQQQISQIVQTMQMQQRQTQAQATNQQTSPSYQRDDLLSPPVHSVSASPPAPHSSFRSSSHQSSSHSQQVSSDLHNPNWSLAQVQQLQQQILQLTNMKQKQQEAQAQTQPQSSQHQHHHQSQIPGQGPIPSPSQSHSQLTVPSHVHTHSPAQSHFHPPQLLHLSSSSSVLSRPTSWSSYEESPRSSAFSPSHRSSLAGYGSSAASSPWGSVKSQSHSRTLSTVGALNPHANEFNPNSPLPQTHSPLTERRIAHAAAVNAAAGGRGASSTPIGFGSSPSPPSSAASHTRSIDSNYSGGVVSPPQQSHVHQYHSQQQQQPSVDDQLVALGLPSHPFDARELDAQIARERDDHAAYIYNFRVQVCQAYLEGTCPYDAYSCFQTHARLPRRRKPILQHGRFNYIPTRCFAFSTPVAKADGTVAMIETIAKGDLLQGQDGRVVRVVENDLTGRTNDMWRVDVAGVEPFVATGDHPMTLSWRSEHSLPAECACERTVHTGDLFEISVSELADRAGSLWSIDGSSESDLVQARLCPVQHAVTLAERSVRVDTSGIGIGADGSGIHFGADEVHESIADVASVKRFSQSSFARAKLDHDDVCVNFRQVVMAETVAESSMPRYTYRAPSHDDQPRILIALHQPVGPAHLTDARGEIAGTVKELQRVWTLTGTHGRGATIAETLPMCDSTHTSDDIARSYDAICAAVMQTHLDSGVSVVIACGESSCQRWRAVAECVPGVDLVSTQPITAGRGVESSTYRYQGREVTVLYASHPMVGGRDFLSLSHAVLAAHELTWCESLPLPSSWEERARLIAPICSITPLAPVADGHPFARLEVMAITPIDSESDRRFLLGSGVLAHNCRYVIEDKECPQGVHCVDGATLVSMADCTTKRLDSIVAGDLVLAYTAASGGLVVPRRVEALLDQGTKACIELAFIDGRTLVCTPDHRVLLTTGKWLEAGQLEPGAMVACSQPTTTVPSVVPQEQKDEESEKARDLPGLPLFGVQLIGRRDAGDRPVFDLSVPVMVSPPSPLVSSSSLLSVSSLSGVEFGSSSLQDDEASFVASGLIVHNCRFSHVTEEVIYHASKFKTQLCTHPIDKEGRCGGYGSHCAKAHGPLDLRQPVFESTDDGSHKATPHDFYDFVCPPAQRELERKYYMYVYKTKKCVGFPFNCSCDGLDYHREEERRRGPIIKYAPTACPNVKPYLNAEWSKPNVDCSGRFKPKIMRNGQLVPQESDEWDCEYAHTLLELMYHPQVYKTGACDHFDEDATNTWNCAHSHGRDDIRTKEEATEDWRVHLLSAFPNATSLPSLTRLLSAGQAALENLNSLQSKQRGGPTGMAQSGGPHHRRGASMSREQAQSIANIQSAMSRAAVSSMTHLTAGRAQMTFQTMNVTNANYQQQQQQSSEPSVSQQQQQRPPMHLAHSAGALMVSPPQRSPRHIPISSASMPLPLPQPSPKSSGLGLGFFSGSDTAGLWAPSPNTMPSAAHTKQRFDRFTFENGGGGSDATAGHDADQTTAWPSDASAEEPQARLQRHAEQSGIGGFGLAPPSSLLVMDDRGAPLPPRSPTAADTNTDADVLRPPLSTQVSLVSPDAMMPASVVQTLWASPPTAEQTAPAPVEEWRAELSAHLQCASISDDVAATTHLLHTPVSTLCCGVSFCQQCIGAHLDRCQSSAQVALGEEVKRDSSDAAAAVITVTTCTCGRVLLPTDVEQLRHAPVNQTLHQLTQWVRQSEAAARHAHETRKGGQEDTRTIVEESE